MAVDTLDILTPAEAYAAINMTSGHEGELQQRVTAMSRIIDSLCGPVVVRSVTEYHDGGVPKIWPRETPVSEVTTVKEWDGSTLTTLTEDTFGVAGNADGFRLDSDGHNVKILRRSSGSAAQFGSGQVELVYVAGRYKDTASVDQRFKDAGASILRRLWDREAGAWARADDPFDQQPPGSSRFFNAVEHVVKEMLHDEMRAPAVA